MPRWTTTVIAVWLVAGCTPRPPAGAQPTGDSTRAAGDSVIVPGTLPMPPDALATGEIVLEGAASIDTISVGEMSVLRATNAEQAESARRAVGSGMYLGDPAGVLRLSPRPGRPASAALGRALPVGHPLSVELLARVDGEGRAPALRVEHSAPLAAGGRRMPSAFAIELLPDSAGGYGRARLLLGGRDWSGQPAVELGELDWKAYAHRVSVAITPALVRVAVDGVVLLEQPVRLAGPTAAPRIVAETDVAGSDVLVLEWIVESD